MPSQHEIDTYDPQPQSMSMLLGFANTCVYEPATVSSTHARTVIESCNSCYWCIRYDNISTLFEKFAELQLRVQNRGKRNVMTGTCQSHCRTLTESHSDLKSEVCRHQTTRQRRTVSSPLRHRPKHGFRGQEASQWCSPGLFSRGIQESKS